MTAWHDRLFANYCSLLYHSVCSTLYSTKGIWLDFSCIAWSSGQSWGSKKYFSSFYVPYVFAKMGIFERAYSITVDWKTICLTWYLSVWCHQKRFDAKKCNNVFLTWKTTASAMQQVLYFSIFLRSNNVKFATRDFGCGRWFRTR